MAKKTKQNELKPVAKTAENKPSKNHNVLIGLLALGIVILLFMLFQSQQTISEQRTKIVQQQQQITILTEENEKLKEVNARTILDDTGQLIIQKGTELFQEIITPQ